MVAGGPEECGFDEVLGFRAGDEDGGGDAEVEGVELLVAGEVLEGLAGGAAGDEGVEGGELLARDFGFGVGEDVGTVASDGVGEEGFGVAASVGPGDAGDGCGEGGAEGHGFEVRINGWCQLKIERQELAGSAASHDFFAPVAGGARRKLAIVIGG